MTEELKDPGILVDNEGNEIQAPPISDSAPAASDAAPDEEDTALRSDSDEEHADEPSAKDETAEEAEARRERNRQRREENKARRKEHIESLRREIAARDELLQQQAARLDALERRTNGADIAAVNVELQKAADAYNYFKTQHAEAVSSANGQLATEAFEKMQAALTRAQQLDNIRKAAQRNQQQPAAQPLDPRMKVHAEGWLQRNSWYDPDGKDMDSRITLTIDQELHREGWNPLTTQYWEELDARVKKYLPHRARSSYNKSQGSGSTPPSRSPVAGSGKETSSATGGYRLSPERVQALRDAGLWDDPKQRADAIRRYQEFDKQQGAR